MKAILLMVMVCQRMTWGLEKPDCPVRDLPCLGNEHKDDVQGNTAADTLLNLSRIFCGCKFVIRGVSINLFDDNNQIFTEEDFNIFYHLQEINDILFLRNINMNGGRIIFPNLRIIRGKVWFRIYGLKIALRVKNVNASELILPKLAEISRGGVQITSSPQHALLNLWQVLWSDIIDVTRWDFWGDNIENTTKPEGCVDCPSGYCWSPTYCQTLTRVVCNDTTHKGRRCYQLSNNQTEICHSQCAAGCSGPSPSNCNACRHYNSNGTCVEACPTCIYDTRSFQLVPVEEVVKKYCVPINTNTSIVCPTSSSISSSSYDIITDTTVTMESIDNTLYVTFTDTPVTTMESIETSRNSTSKWRVLVISISGLAAIAILTVGTVVIFTVTIMRRKRKPTKNEYLDQTQTMISNDYAELSTSTGLNNVQLKTTSFTSDIKIESKYLDLGEIVGQGEFGIVYKGKLMRKGAHETVAVKTVKGFLLDDIVDDFLEECVKLSQLKHPNVMEIVGVCLDRGSVPYLVMPFMSNGNLLQYLKTNREKLVVPDDKHSDEVSQVQKMLLDICLQISKGMEYLASERIIHRDLSARNCMIDINFMIKVSDFGLSKRVFENKDYFRLKDSGTKLPIKWLSPESFQDGVFSEKTDVWSFGVTCWEVFTGGKQPYPGIHPLHVLELLESGQRMSIPANVACSKEIYEFMLRCWEKEPDTRPTFSDIVVSLTSVMIASADYLLLCSSPQTLHMMD